MRIGIFKDTAHAVGIQLTVLVRNQAADRHDELFALVLRETHSGVRRLAVADVIARIVKAFNRHGIAAFYHRHLIRDVLDRGVVKNDLAVLGALRAFHGLDFDSRVCRERVILHLDDVLHHGGLIKRHRSAGADRLGNVFKQIRQRDVVRAVAGHFLIICRARVFFRRGILLQFGKIVQRLVVRRHALHVILDGIGTSDGVVVAVRCGKDAQREYHSVIIRLERIRLLDRVIGDIVVCCAAGRAARLAVRKENDCRAASRRVRPVIEDTLCHLKSFVGIRAAVGSQRRNALLERSAVCRLERIVGKIRRRTHRSTVLRGSAAIENLVIACVGIGKADDRDAMILVLCSDRINEVCRRNFQRVQARNLQAADHRAAGRILCKRFRADAEPRFMRDCVAVLSGLPNTDDISIQNMPLKIERLAAAVCSLPQFFDRDAAVQHVFRHGAGLVQHENDIDRDRFLGFDRFTRGIAFQPNTVSAVRVQLQRLGHVHAVHVCTRTRRRKQRRISGSCGH